MTARSVFANEFRSILSPVEHLVSIHRFNRKHYRHQKAGYKTTSISPPRAVYNDLHLSQKLGRDQEDAQIIHFLYFTASRT